MILPKLGLVATERRLLVEEALRLPCRAISGESGRIARQVKGGGDVLAHLDMVRMAIAACRLKRDNYLRLDLAHQAGELARGGFWISLEIAAGSSLAGVPAMPESR